MLQVVDGVGRPMVLESFGGTIQGGNGVFRPTQLEVPVDELAHQPALGQGVEGLPPVMIL